MLARIALRQAPRRSFATKGGSDTIKDLFATEFAAVTKRLGDAAAVEKEVPAAVMKAMKEEAAAAQQRTGLMSLGEVPLSSKLKIGNL